MGEEACQKLVHMQVDVLICKTFTLGTENNPVMSARNAWVARLNVGIRLCEVLSLQIVVFLTPAGL